MTPKQGNWSQPPLPRSVPCERFQFYHAIVPVLLIFLRSA
jgi:hypothetical protein